MRIRIILNHGLLSTSKVKLCWRNLFLCIFRHELANSGQNHWFKENWLLLWLQKVRSGKKEGLDLDESESATLLLAVQFQKFNIVGIYSVYV